MPLSVEILTPEKIVLQRQADSVVVPAFEGEMGILPKHVPLIAQLAPGEIRMRAGSEAQSFAVSGGFVEVQSDGRVVILAETAEMAQDIDVERARQAAERARGVLKSAKADVDLTQAEAALRRALARLRVVEGIRRKQKPTR